MTYSEKLRDPRWQKKRLEVFQRDDFRCLACGSDNRTLNVHHLKYHSNPWDTSPEFLETLCDSCHKLRTNFDVYWKDFFGDSLLTSTFAVRSILQLFMFNPKAINKRSSSLMKAIEKTVDLERIKEKSSAGQQVKSGVHGIPAPIGQDGTLNIKPRDTETASALAGEGPEGAAEGNLAASTRTVVGNHPLQDVGSHEAQVPTAREP